MDFEDKRLECKSHAIVVTVRTRVCREGDAAFGCFHAHLQSRDSMRVASYIKCSCPGQRIDAIKKNEPPGSTATTITQPHHHLARQQQTQQKKTREKARCSPLANCGRSHKPGKGAAPCQRAQPREQATRRRITYTTTKVAAGSSQSRWTMPRPGKA